MPIRPNPSAGFSLVAATVGTLIYTAGGAFLTVSLAPAARQMGLADVQAGLILSLGVLAGVILAPVWGYASERFGRRGLMLLATAMVALSPAVMAAVFAKGSGLAAPVVFATLLTARLVQTAFGAALIPLTQGTIAALTSAERRVNGMGVMSVAVTLGTVSGAELVWATARSGVATGLTTIAVFGVVAVIVVALGLPATQPAASLPVSERIVPAWRIWPNIAITALGYAAYTMVSPLLGLRFIDRFGFATADAIGAAGLILAIAGLAQALTQGLVAVRLPWRPATLLWLGAVGALLGLGGLIVANGLVAIGLALVVTGGALGFVAPANLALLSLAAGRGAQGKVAGINAAARGVGLALGPLAGTSLYSVNHDLPLYGAGGVIVVVIGLAVVAARADRREPATG